MNGADGALIHEEYTAVLQRIAWQRPLLLILDDLQWSDTATIALLYHLARRISNHRILITGIYRPEEVLWHTNQPHPLSALVEELQRRNGPIRVSLDLQESAEGRYFVDALLDSEPNHLDEGFRRDLFEHTQGHALFTVELVRQMREMGQLTRGADGCWGQREPVNWQVLPAKIEAMIARRLHRLSPELYETLAAASVEGELFALDVLTRVLNKNHRTLALQLSALGDDEHRLVTGVGAEHVGSLRLLRYRFRHKLIQQYLYRSLDPTKRQLLHEQVGMALEALCHCDGTVLVQVAHVLASHFEQAGAPEKASEYHLLAGRGPVGLSNFNELTEHRAGSQGGPRA